jgi:hypothetical protein
MQTIYELAKISVTAWRSKGQWLLPTEEEKDDYFADELEAQGVVSALVLAPVLPGRYRSSAAITENTRGTFPGRNHYGAPCSQATCLLTLGWQKHPLIASQETLWVRPDAIVGQLAAAVRRRQGVSGLSQLQGHDLREAFAGLQADAIIASSPTTASFMDAADAERQYPSARPHLRQVLKYAKLVPSLHADALKAWCTCHRAPACTCMHLAPGTWHLAMDSYCVAALEAHRHMHQRMHQSDSWQLAPPVAPHHLAHAECMSCLWQHQCWPVSQVMPASWPSPALSVPPSVCLCFRSYYGHAWSVVNYSSTGQTPIVSIDSYMSSSCVLGKGKGRAGASPCEKKTLSMDFGDVSYCCSIAAHESRQGCCCLLVTRWVAVRSAHPCCWGYAASRSKPCNAVAAMTSQSYRLHVMAPPLVVRIPGGMRVSTLLLLAGMGARCQETGG